MTNLELLEKTFTEKRIPLSSFALSLTKDWHSADDLIQDTLLKAVKNIDQLKDQSTVMNWLFTSIKRSYLDKIRAKSDIKRFNFANIEEVSEDSFVKEFDDSAPDYTKIYNIVDKLSNKLYKEIIELYYFRNLSANQISQKLKINENSIKIRLFRARIALKKAFQNHGITYHRIKGFCGQK